MIRPSGIGQDSNLGVTVYMDSVNVTPRWPTIVFVLKVHGTISCNQYTYFDTSINNLLYLSTNVLNLKLNPVWDDHIASKFQWVSDYNYCKQR